MPDPTVQDVMARPAFSKLSPGAQYQVLAGVHPALDKVSEQARPQVLKGLKDKYGIRTKGGVEEMLPTDASDWLRKPAQFVDAAVNRGIQTTGKLAEFVAPPYAKQIHHAIAEDKEHLPDATTTAGKAGEVAQEGLMWAAPIPGLGEAKTAGRVLSTGERVLQTAAHGAYEVGTRDLLATGDPKSATISAAGGAVTGGLFESLRNPVAKLLSEGARRYYARILQPGGGKVKQMVRNTLLTGTERDLVGRGVIARTSGELEARAAEETDEWAARLNERYQELAPIASGAAAETGQHGPDYRINLRAVYDGVFKVLGDKGIFKEDGGIKDPAYLNMALQKLTELTERLGPEIGTATPAKLREFRQSLEASLYKMDANKVNVRRTVEGASDEFTDAMARSIRETLNKDKTIGAMNREYHFWETAREIMRARNIKETGQLSAAQRHGYTIGRTLAMGMGIGSGEEIGRREGGYKGAAMGAALGVAGGLALVAALETTAIRSVGAVAMDRFARMLATPGSEKAAAGFLAREVAKVTNRAEEAENLNKLGRNAVDEWRAEQAAQKAAAQAQKDAAEAKKAQDAADKLRKQQSDMRSRQQKEQADAAKKAEGEAKKAEDDALKAEYRANEERRKQELHDKKMAGGPTRRGGLATPATPLPITAGGPVPDIRNYTGKTGIADFKRDKAAWEKLNPKGGGPPPSEAQAPAPAPSQPESPQGKGGVILPVPKTDVPNATSTTPLDTGGDSGSAGGQAQVDSGGVGGRPEVQTGAAPGKGSEFGKETEILIPGEDISIRGRYRIRDLSEITGSHNHASLKPNAGYPYKNERDYGTPGNAQRVLSQGSEERFRHEYHINNVPNATDGPMVVDEDGYSISGSGRRIQLGMIHDVEGGAARAKYLAGLKQDAHIFGIQDVEAAMAGKKNPVLVREVSRADIEKLPEGVQWAIRKTNISGTAALSAGERAIADAGQMTQPLVDRVSELLEATGPDASINEALDGPEGPELINRLIHEGFFTEQERNTLTDTVTGRVTKAAKERISNAMLGKFFINAEHIDNVPDALRNKLERIAAPVLRTAGGGEWDLMPRIKQAMEFREYMNVKGYKRLNEIYANPSLGGLGPELPKYTAKTEDMDRILNTMNPNDLARSMKLYASRFKEHEFAQIPNFFPVEAMSEAEAFEEAFGPGTAPSPPPPAPSQAAAQEAASPDKKPPPRAPRPAKSQPGPNSFLSAHRTKTVRKGKTVLPEPPTPEPE